MSPDINVLPCRFYLVDIGIELDQKLLEKLKTYLKANNYRILNLTEQQIVVFQLLRCTASWIRTWSSTLSASISK